MSKAGALAATAKLSGMQFAVKCGSTISCTYGGEPTFNVATSEAGVMTIRASGLRLTTVKGSACPKETFLDSTYTALGTMWIES